MRQTSLEAYFEAVQPDLNEKQKVVFEAIVFLGKASDQDIADYLQWTINRVTGRRNELFKKNSIYHVDTVKNQFNRNVCRWGAVKS